MPTNGLAGLRLHAAPTKPAAGVRRPVLVCVLRQTYTPILPPPCLVIASTDGLTGMSGLKSGQRVDGSS